MPGVRLEVVATTTQQVKLAPKVKQRLLTELKSYAAAKSTRDTADGVMKGARGAIEEVMSQAGEERLEIDGFKTTMIAPVTRKLNVKKLVALGVPMDLIDQAYDETPGTPYVKVTIPGVKADE